MILQAGLPAGSADALSCSATHFMQHSPNARPSGLARPASTAPTGSTTRSSLKRSDVAVDRASMQESVPHPCRQDFLALDVAFHLGVSAFATLLYYYNSMAQYALNCGRCISGSKEKPQKHGAFSHLTTKRALCHDKAL